MGNMSAPESNMPPFLRSERDVEDGLLIPYQRVLLLGESALCLRFFKEVL